MTIALKVAALVWLLVLSVLCLVMATGTVQGLIVWIGWLPRELTDPELFTFATFCVLVVGLVGLVVGGPMLDIRLGARFPSRREQQQLDEAAEEINQAFAARHGRPIKVSWRVLDTNEYQAMAYGRSSIAVSRQFLRDATDSGHGQSVLKGVIAHELGHIHHRDTMVTLLMIVSAWPIALARLVAIAMFVWIPYAGPILVLALRWLFFLLEWPAWFLLAASSKGAEYRADRFAAQLVGAEGLTEFFDFIAPLDVNEGQGVVAHYMRSHPPIEHRRGRLEAFAEETQ